MQAGSPLHRWAVVVGITGFVVGAAAALALLATTGTDPVAVTVLSVMATVALVMVLQRTLGGTAAALRRLTADSAVIVEANPSHRLPETGVGELVSLVRAVNRLADQYEAAVRGAEEQAEATRRDVESERNRLAALMSQLTVAVVVCNREGRILLYNEAARSLMGDETPVGLGRSVFGVVDRGLVAHAYERLASGARSVYTATTLHGDQLLSVRVTLVREPGRSQQEQEQEQGSGFVLVLEDLTRQVRAGDRRDRVLRQLIEGTRASLGSIRAAVESVLEFPELTHDERHRFLEIVREEADRLGGRVDHLVGETGGLTEDRVPTDIAGDDLLGVLAKELARAGIACSAEPVQPPVWLRADGYALARALALVLRRLQETAGIERFTLTLTSAGRHGQLDACWSGRGPSSSALGEWLDEALDGRGTTTVRDVADRHGAEIWSGDVDEETAYVRVLLPTATRDTRQPTVPTHAEVESRPEFYDFDLFTARPRAEDVLDHRLEDMAFTVFDTETTGLDPSGGDRIISIGAVRVVNGRVLRQETFERLVQPRRSVPAASTAIHGITADMLEGEPTIDEVLPAFARFAEDTVLVGHNVGFDLRFVKMAEADAGVSLSQPALDTLLLHAVLHPDHEEHTLEAIAERMGVSVVGRHTALGDALVTAEVFVALLSMLRSRGLETLGETLAAARTTYQSRLDERLYGR
jgi:DNA polymerase III subunit epsilon